jgi:hypothetical protein
VIIGDEAALDRGADLTVEPDDGVKSEQALHDAGPQPSGCPAAVAFEAELVLQGPDDRLDALPQPVREGPGRWLVFAGGADQGEVQLWGGEELCGVLAAMPLSVTMAVPGGGRLAGWSLNICRAWSRLPTGLRCRRWVSDRDRAPGEVFLRLGADALDWCRASQTNLVALEGIRERFLPECALHSRDKRKLQFAVLVVAALHRGAEPDLLDEVAAWQTDDCSQYATFAAVAYIRIAADRTGVPVHEVCQDLTRRTGPRPG